jgi:hypothetical protein
MGQRQERTVDSSDVASGKFCRVVTTPSAADTDVCGLDPAGNGRPARAFRTNGAGNLVVHSPGDRDTAGADVYATIPCLAGEYHPLQVSRIESTGSTATNVILYW